MSDLKAGEKNEKLVNTKGSQSKSRAGLMAVAKERKIKYFRILSKAELQEILVEGTTEDRIKEIQDQAVTRWKKGWKQGRGEKTVCA